MCLSFSATEEDQLTDVTSTLNKLGFKPIFRRRGEEQPADFVAEAATRSVRRGCTSRAWPVPRRREQQRASHLHAQRNDGRTADSLYGGARVRSSGRPTSMTARATRNQHMLMEPYKW